MAGWVRRRGGRVDRHWEGDVCSSVVGESGSGKGASPRSPSGGCFFSPFFSLRWGGGGGGGGWILPGGRARPHDPDCSIGNSKDRIAEIVEGVVCGAFAAARSRMIFQDTICRALKSGADGIRTISRRPIQQHQKMSRERPARPARGSKLLASCTAFPMPDAEPTD